MNDSPAYSHELRSLLTKLCDGVLNDEDYGRLEQILLSDSVARTFYRRYLELHSMLQFEDQPKSPPAVEASPPRSADEFLHYVRHASSQDTWRDECVADLASRGKLPIVPDVDPSYPGQLPIQSPQDSGLGGSGASAFALSAFLLQPWVVLGMIVLSAVVGAGLALGWNAERQMAKTTVGVDEARQLLVENQAPAPVPFAATLAKITNCRWDPARSTADVIGGTVRPGQSLSLLEGVAEINTSLSSGGVGRFLLEGPLSMILTSQGMPNVQYGKMTADITCGFDRYMLDTPVGRVAVPYAASIGLIANADNLELHVFDGEAVFESPWRIESEDPMESSSAAEQVIVSAGDSIRIRATSDTEIQHGKANRALFASQVSMAADELNISAQYVAAVRKSAPVCYWRFEGEDENCVRNEIDDRLHLRVMGDGVRWRTYPGNRVIELGSTSEVGYLVTDDTVNGLIEDDYTLEMWVKPSHFHHGALFSLIVDPQRPTQAVGSGLLVELRGPAYAWQSLYPGRLRYLHRNSPRSFSSGTSVYSEPAYEPRSWQYVVAKKTGPTMQLYLNDCLAAAAEESTQLFEGMRVLIGQLYPLYKTGAVTTRPYMGEIDEVALYSRALSEGELSEHYWLACPPSSVASRETSGNGMFERNENKTRRSAVSNPIEISEQETP